MTKSRLEAFSDGVIAILITIMVLELKVPHASDLAVLEEMLPTFLAYLLSYVVLGIYWNNHHHMLHIAGGISGAVLWANLHLLFWLSLLPFATGWMGENHFAALPTALYGVLLLGSACAYKILQTTLIRAQGRGGKLDLAVGKDKKGLAPLVLYALAVPAAFYRPWISYAIYIGVALLWLVPDRRIEKQLSAPH
ncbi:MAG: TMEM175 family protein [Myxococcota bacterium]